MYFQNKLISCITIFLKYTSSTSWWCQTAWPTFLAWQPSWIGALGLKITLQTINCVFISSPHTFTDLSLFHRLPSTKRAPNSWAGKLLASRRISNLNFFLQPYQQQDGKFWSCVMVDCSLLFGIYMLFQWFPCLFNDSFQNWDHWSLIDQQNQIVGNINYLSGFILISSFASLKHSVCVFNKDSWSSHGQWV